MKKRYLSHALIEHMGRDVKRIQKGRAAISDDKARMMIEANKETARRWLEKHHEPYRKAGAADREKLFRSLYTITPEDVLWAAGQQKTGSCYTYVPLASLENLAIGRIDPKNPEWSRQTICLGENRLHLARGNLTLAEWDTMMHRGDRAAEKFERPYPRFRVIRPVLGIAPKKKKPKAHRPRRKISLSRGTSYAA